MEAQGPEAWIAAGAAQGRLGQGGQSGARHAGKGSGNRALFSPIASQTHWDIGLFFSSRPGCSLDGELGLDEPVWQNESQGN